MHRSAMPCLLLTAALLLIASSPVLAQEETFGWGGTGEVSYVSTSGNTDTATLGFATEMEYLQRVWSAELKGNFVRSENEGVESARALAATAALLRELRPRLGSYVRTSYMKNRFAGIERLLTTEAGLGWDVVEDERQKLRFEAGIGYTDEQRLDAPDLSFASGRGGLKYRWNISEYSSFREELSVLTNLSGLGDLRVLNTASVTAGLNSRLSLKLSHTLSWVDDPVPGFESTDMTTAAALVAKWGRE